MNRLNAVTASLITSLLAAPLCGTAAYKPARENPKRRPLRNDFARRIRAITELPDDPALPALVAIRTACLIDAMPAQEIGGRPV